MLNLPTFQALAEAATRGTVICCWAVNTWWWWSPGLQWPRCHLSGHHLTRGFTVWTNRLKNLESGKWKISLKTPPQKQHWAPQILSGRWEETGAFLGAAEATVSWESLLVGSYLICLTWRPSWGPSLWFPPEMRYPEVPGSSNINCKD